MLLALALLIAALPLAACGGEEEELEVVEGEPIVVDDVSYNVVISRFLNPDDVEDAEYLAGEPDPPDGEQYFGVFMQIENDGDEAVALPNELTVVDTADNIYGQLNTDNQYALPLGDELPPDGSVPDPDSTPYYGPTQGALVLFLVSEASAENRPLRLEVPLPSGDVGEIELDI